MDENIYLQSRNQKKLENKKTTRIIIVSLLIIVSFFIGIIIGVSNSEEINPSDDGGKVLNKNKVPEYLSQDVNFKLFWQVWNSIKDNYVEPNVNEVEMFYGAQAGLVASLLDPYSVFLPPDIAKDFSDELEGKFEGIGAEIGIKNNSLTIIAPLPNSPAEKSGIKAGDKVLGINGLDTAGISLNQAVNLIRGDKGTEVILNVMHKDQSREDITIIRDKIQYASVKSELKEEIAKKINEENIGYIEISHFNEDTEKLFNEKVDELINQGVDSIILDLRNNPGGFLSTAISVASAWVEDGIIVKEKFRDDSKTQNYSAQGNAKLKDKKTVVLVNGGSASASEIVAGALQDYGLATIIGEKTFGKGSVQDLTKLSDGSSVKLTIAKWLTPNNRAIDKEGIVPDIEIELTTEDYNNDRDPQLEKAIEILKQ